MNTQVAAIVLAGGIRAEPLVNLVNNGVLVENAFTPEFRFHECSNFVGSYHFFGVSLGGADSIEFLLK
ncbi:hypothetical protein [Bradyrhizobium diazoefficiens]